MEWFHIDFRGGESHAKSIQSSFRTQSQHKNINPILSRKNHLLKTKKIFLLKVQYLEENLGRITLLPKPKLKIIVKDTSGKP